LLDLRLLDQPMALFPLELARSRRAASGHQHRVRQKQRASPRSRQEKRAAQKSTIEIRSSWRDRAKLAVGHVAKAALYWCT
jgi:hypothetical protein